MNFKQQACATQDEHVDRVGVFWRHAHRHLEQVGGGLRHGIGLLSVWFSHMIRNMSDWPKRRRTPLDVPHPNSAAGRNSDGSSLGAPHPNSPAGRNFDYWSSLGMPHPNSPVGRTASQSHLRQRSPESEFRLGSTFEGWDDFAGWASGAADTVRSFLKNEPIELFGDVKSLGGASTLLDAVHEYRTHPRDSSGILGDTGAVEGKLFLTAVAPWLAIAALVVDPILQVQHRQGIMDAAGEAGRTAVQEFIRQFPTDRDAVVWLVRFASEGNQRANSTFSSNLHRAVAHKATDAPKPSAKPHQPAFQPRTDWSELDKAIAQDDKDLKQKGLDDFLREK